MCESITHFVKDCPHNGSSAYVTESESSDAILVTVNQNEEMFFWMKESLYFVVLSSGCSSTVAGKNWTNCYLESLPEQSMIQISKTETKL